MSTWSSGYVADSSYTYGYYHELNPNRVELAFLYAGLEFPKISNACELGFGQGISVNIHAAANHSIKWFGTDFNPEQAGFAETLSDRAGNNAILSDQGFEEFCKRIDLPKFDYICLHGIWSWISDENRKVITNFVKENLAVGGVLYVSYNTFPGWSAAAPIRHLLSQYSQHFVGNSAGYVQRIDQSFQFVDSLFSTSPKYTLQNPLALEKFQNIKSQDKNYLSHEYLNRDWEPMYFNDMVNWLEETKLSYACSAHYPDHIWAINMSTEQQQLLNTIPNINYRESIRDYIVNQQFRKDYWVKGARKLDSMRQAELLRAHRVILITPRDLVALKVNGARGEGTLHESIYDPLLNLLSDYQIHELGKLEISLQEVGISLAQITEALVMLVGIGYVQSVQNDSNIDRSVECCRNINLQIALRARTGVDISFFASPVTGGGIAMPRFFQLFWLALQNGFSEPKEWAKYVWSTVLAPQGQTIVKEGKALEDTEEIIGELTSDAQIFANKYIQILKALKIA